MTPDPAGLAQTPVCAVDELGAEACRRLRDLCLVGDLSGVDVLVSDAVSGRFLAFNRSAHEHLGYCAEELLQLSPERIQADPDHDAAWVAARRRELLEAGGGAFQTRHRCKDASIRDVAIHHTVLDLDGRQVIVSAMHDRTLAQQVERQLENAVELLDAGEAHSGIGTWEYRFHDGRLRWSRQCHRLCRSDPAGPAPTLWSYGLLVHPDDRSAWRQAFQRSVNRGVPLHSRHRLAFPDGSEALVQLSGRISFDAAGNPLRLVASLRDGSDERSLHHAFERARLVDGLTGLPNKAAALRELDRRLIGRGYGDSLAVLSLDVDGFQEINDNFGSDVGDQLLQVIGQRLQASLGPDTWVGRLSSDQFVLIVDQDIRSVGDAMATARALRQQWAESPGLIPELDLLPSFCIGIATYPEHGHTGQRVLQCANTALTEAKRGGRSQICVYSTGLSRQIHERMQLGSELAQAINREQLRLVVQPQSHRDGSLSGGEVLLRWTNRRGIQVPPSQFIPLAEDSGLIFPISSWVIGSVLQRISAWRRQGLSLPRLAVNISPRQFELPGRRFVSELLESLAEHNLSPEQLELEITETALVRNPVLTGEQLRVLADQGFRIAIDDFGTGYSSLELLRKLPVHRLKIDRTFVQGIAASAEDQAIVQATLTLARGMGMECIAEGVETEEQRQRLEDLGCEFYQGHLYSKPLDLDGFAQLLAQQPTGQVAQQGPWQPRASAGGEGLGSRPRTCSPSTFEQLQLLRSALENTSDNVLLLRSLDGPDGAVMDYEIIEANPAVAAAMRQDRDAPVNQTLLSIFPQMESNGLFALFSDATNRGSATLLENFGYANHEVNKDDRVFDIQVTPSREFLTVIWRDVTERQRTHRSLAEAAALYRLLAENIVEVLVLADGGQCIRWVSPSLQPMTGWLPQQWQGKRFGELFVAAQGEPLPVDLEHWLADYGAIRQGRLRLVDSQGGWGWVEVSVRRLDGHPDGEELPRYVLTLQPVDEQVQRERRLMRLAHTDPLTGLESRATILEWLQRRLGEGGSARAQPLGLLFCDLDDFKGINDSRGHAAGDAVLQAVAQRIRSSLRSHDRVGRIGGDEFLVILDGTRLIDHVLQVEQKVKMAVSGPVPWADAPISTSISIGAVIHAAGEDAELFLKRADHAMYAAKAAGRNRVSRR